MIEMWHVNIFRLVGDFLRLFAVIGLPIKLWTTKNSSGVSGKTQILYALVCTARYLDLMTMYISAYNTCFKIAFILISYLTIYLIYGKFKDTYSSNEDSFRISYLLTGAAVIALAINHGYSVIEISWAFSIYLEAVAMVPQLLMLYRDKTNETRSFIYYYVFAMGTYRAFYVMNWYYRYMNEHHYDLIAECAGGVQLAVYVVFSCLYISRGERYSLVADNPITVNI